MDDELDPIYEEIDDLKRELERLRELLAPSAMYRSIEKYKQRNGL